MKKVFIILLALIFLAPVASGNAGVLFEDDFEDGNRNGWTHIVSDEGPVAGHWIVVDEPSRGKVLEGTAPPIPPDPSDPWPIPQYLKLDSPDLPDKFILEFEAKTVSDGGISASLFGFYVPWLGWGGDGGYIGVHRYRPTQFPSFRINTWALNCVQNNTSPQDTSDTPFEWHSFKLVKDENWYTFYYDNKFVFQGWVDSSCTDLGGHLVLATSRSNITRFDNIRISTIPDEVARYTVTDLGTLDGTYEKVYATAINERGQIIGGGFWYDSTGELQLSGWIWDETNGMQELEDLGGWRTYASDIGNSGQVVGSSMDSSDSDRTHGIVWENGSILYDLGRASASGINNLGQVVGTYPGGSFIWDSVTGLQDLPVVDVDVRRINDLGQITGEDQSGEYLKPIVWNSTNGLQHLMLPSGYSGGYAVEINNLGQITGYVLTDTPPDSNHAILWNDVNDHQILGTLGGSHSYATGINDFGVVVGGSSVVGSSKGRAFIWDSINGMRDLNDLLVPGHGFEFISAALDVNNAGEIVGRGHIDSANDIYHAVLLTPVPEPSDLYSETVMGDNPFAYYRLGELEVTNPVLDEMGTHHGSCQNNPTLGVSGALLSNPADTAMCFDSSQSQYIELTTLGNFGSRFPEGFSVEYWLKTDDPNNHQSILGTANSPDFITDFLVDIGYEGNSGGLRIYFRDDHWKRYNAWFFPEGNNIDIYDDTWHHIVHVYDPSASAVEDRVIYYIDGVRQTVDVELISDVPPYDSSDFNHPMTLGAFNRRGEIVFHLNGCLDEVAFYLHPLAEDEVLSHYLASICEPKIIWDPDTIETVLSPTGTDTWESNQLWYPRVMYEDGEYEMWYAGTPGYSYEGNSGIGYATSLDGVNWSDRQRVHGPETQPSFQRSDSPFVIKEGDAYKMWHRDYYEGACGEWSGYVSHMTSTDGINWVNHQRVLGAQGISGPQQDGYDINGISILKEEDQYVMWYTVHDCPSADPRYRPKIWRATSNDGITWTNRQLSLPYIPDTWEYNVYDPHVVSDNCGGYVMYYTAYSDETGQQLAVATSTDGITWTNRQQIGAAGRAPFYVDVDGTPYLYFSRGDDIDEGYEIARMRGTKVVENQPPVAVCQDVTVPTDPGVCTATASVDDGSFDPDGDEITVEQLPPGPYPLGTNTVTLTVTDENGASDTCSATVTVEDQEPPTIQNIMASPDTLWPPNHKMKPVSVIVSISDNCDQDLDIVLTSVVCDEPDNALDVGDGHTTNDIQDADIGTEDYAISLRAERQGEGDGRIYTITYTATDDSSNSATADIKVTVPYELE